MGDDVYKIKELQLLIKRLEKELSDLKDEYDELECDEPDSDDPDYHEWEDELDELEGQIKKTDRKLHDARTELEKLQK